MTAGSPPQAPASSIVAVANMARACRTLEHRNSSAEILGAGCRLPVRRAEHDHEIARRAAGISAICYPRASEHAFAVRRSQAVFHAFFPAAQVALKHSYRVDFTEAFDHILLIAAAIAFVGAVLALVLVRQRDFVAS